MTYRCKKEYHVTLNSKHLITMLKNVKKKDSLIFFIRENKLCITIQPSNDLSKGKETVELSIQHNDESILPLLPEVFIDKGKEKEVYGYPTTIKSADLQKIKKMLSTSRTVKVKIQGSNYISFFAGDESVMSSQISFGELDDSSSEDEEETETHAMHEIYEESFNVSLFSPLVKLPCVADMVGFYAPLIEKFPLKIKMASGLGSISIFIKHDEGW